MQRLWMSLDKKTWHALAVVPAASEIAVVDVANVIAEVSQASREEPTVVLDLRDVNFRAVDFYKKDIVDRVKKGQSVILVLSPFESTPMTSALARIADAAVLVVRLESTSMKDAARVVEEIGHDKFLGTILASHGAKR
jgi:hypothetical protein